MNVLFICLAGIGDSIMVTPAIEVCKKKLPDSTIDVLSMFSASRELFERNPFVHKVYHWNFVEEGFLKSLRFLRTLRKNKYEISLNAYPQNRNEYNMVSRLIHAPIRIGHVYNHRSLRNMHFLNNRLVREDDTLHNVHENVRLLSFLNIEEPDPPPMRFELSDEWRTFGQTWLRERDLWEGRKRIGLHPGSSTLKNHIHKRWPPEYFARLARQLRDESDVDILLFGGQEEDELRESIKALAGQGCISVQTTSMMETVGVMSHCRAFISNDTSLLHIASAMGLPVIGFFGPTSEIYAYPWKAKSLVLESGIDCRPCFYYSPKPLTCHLSEQRQFACLKELPPENVYLSIREFLKSLS